MSVLPHLYADRLLNVAVTGNLLRIELGTLHAPAKEGEKPQLLPGQTLVMPLDGFLASFGMMEAVVKKMIADGVVKTQPQETKAAPSTPRTPPSSKKK